ncbi:glucose-6-phosphate dehydrogenase, partial [Staphylococcus arlettae]
MSTRNKNIPCLITIFGATGDLSHRKLFPSLFHLYQQENLNEHIAIIGIGRRELTNDDFRSQVKSSIQEHVKNTKHLDKFMEHVFYHKHDVSDEASYESLLEYS